jgi:hypothetical protein
MEFVHCIEQNLRFFSYFAHWESGQLSRYSDGLRAGDPGFDS